ncbi:MAG: transposase, partial [Hydrogenoanaerobacterium sp.]
MAKYSYEIKQKAVMSYIKGEGSYNYVSKQNGITNECVLKKWVNAYREFGDEGLMRSRKNKSYTFEFKLSVVELYLT